MARRHPPPDLPGNIPERSDPAKARQMEISEREIAPPAKAHHAPTRGEPSLGC